MLFQILVYVRPPQLDVHHDETSPCTNVLAKPACVLWRGAWSLNMLLQGRIIQWSVGGDGAATIIKAKLAAAVIASHEGQSDSHQAVMFS